jgi:hypothetical protein
MVVVIIADIKNYTNTIKMAEESEKAYKALQDRGMDTTMFEVIKDNTKITVWQHLTIIGNIAFKVIVTITFVITGYKYTNKK